MQGRRRVWLCRQAFVKLKLVLKDRVVESFDREQDKKRLIGNAYHVAVMKYLLQPLRRIFVRKEYAGYDYQYAWAKDWESWNLTWSCRSPFLLPFLIYTPVKLWKAHLIRLEWKYWKINGLLQNSQKYCTRLGNMIEDKLVYMLYVNEKDSVLYV
jgi:hypothetical protein